MSSTNNYELGSNLASQSLNFTLANGRISLRETKPLALGRIAIVSCRTIIFSHQQ